MIVIFSPRDDPNAQAVRSALDREGAACTVIDTSLLFASGSLGFVQNGDPPHWQLRATLDADALRDSDVSAVWLRHCVEPVVPEGVDPDEEQFVKAELQGCFESLLRSFARDALWVNSYESTRSAVCLASQQRAAQAAGLKIPPTLYSNDPQTIRRFLRSHGEVVRVSARPPYEISPGTERGQMRPGIFQAVVSPAAERTVVAMGQRLFALEGERQIELARGEGDAIHRFLQNMNILFGVMRFAVSSDEIPYFLTLQEQADLLQLEQQSGYPLLDAIGALLQQRTP